MSNKSGVAEQVLPLPKGGGALAGLGETFSPDLHTGTGSFSVPLAVPPGRNGLQPQLTLAYSTGTGNGPFGLGWSLSVPGVSRKTSKGLPRYRDAPGDPGAWDTFVLSGAEDLVPVAQAPGMTEPGTTQPRARYYRPRTEGLFARIAHHQGGGSDYWEVQSKDGLTSRYGTPRPADAPPDWRDPAAVADPDNPCRIFSWKLTQTTDTFGNHIVYRYERDAVQDDGPHRWDQVYLACIEYVDYGDPAHPRFLVSVAFEYAPRPDSFSDYRAGFEIRTVQRCTRIDVTTHAGTDAPVRTYHLLYLDQLRDAGQSVLSNGVSLLQQIRVEGHADTSPNLLANPAFARAGRAGRATTFTSTTGAQGADAAADSWSLWCNPPATITTELLPSSCPMAPTGTAGTMIRVTTTAPHCGLVNVFGFQDTGPQAVVAAAWVYVVRGQVTIGTGNGGSIQRDASSTTTGRWEYLQAPNGVAPANEFIIYANRDGGAEYYVAFASVSTRSTSARSEWLPPLEFGYTAFEPQHRRYEPFPTAGGAVPDRSLADRDYELVDLFADGLPSVLQMNGTVRHWRNRGSGRFDPPRTMNIAPAGVQLAASGVQIADMDGDGRADLLVTDGIRGGYYRLSRDGGWDAHGFRAYRQLPAVDLEDPEVRLVDLDGDGVVDALRTGHSFELYFNDPRVGWTRTEVRPRGSPQSFPDVSFSDPRVKLASMTGSGLQDIVLVYDGRVDYWPYLGYGRWGQRVTMLNSPRFQDAAYGVVGYDPRRVLLGDVDGDGCADLVYVGSAHVTIWLNQSGNAWSAPITVHGTPPVSDLDAVRLVDMHGTGMAGILWSADADSTRGSPYRFLDLTDGVKPYLLNRIDNHRGTVTDVEYAPSTRFYLEDERRVETRWTTRLPFPVQVAHRVKVCDALSGGRLTTEYRYHHGAWDGAEREFRGFGRVDQRDAYSFGDAASGRAPNGSAAPPPYAMSPPTEVRTWFYQGPIGDADGDWEVPDHASEYWPGDSQIFGPAPAETGFDYGLPRQARRAALRTLRGRILRTELYALDGSAAQNRPYTVTEHRHAVGPLPGGAPGADGVYFPRTIAERTTQWERGNDPMTRFVFTGDYDPYGQPRSHIDIAVPRGRNPLVTAGPGEPYLATHTVTAFAQRDDDAVYVVDRVARATVYTIPNDGSAALVDLHETIEAGTGQREVISQTLSFYDGSSFEGLPFGRLGEYGALVRTETLVLTPDLLHAAYRSGSIVADPPEEPPYLSTTGPPAWTVEYPMAFQATMAPLAGYVYHAGGPSSPYAAGYYATVERRQYDVQAGAGGRGLVIGHRDALGHDTTVAFDAFELLPTTVVDAAGLRTAASHDYRVLQVSSVTDPNGNESRFTFTPLGLLASGWVRGKDGTGDQVRASTLLTYDFTAFVERGQPVSVRTLRHVHHDAEHDIPLPERDETIETRAYSDGFGRLLQTRTQTEDVVFGDPVFGNLDPALASGDVIGQPAESTTPRVVVSGWQIYDNKGRVVEKYEPYFAAGWEYTRPTDAHLSASRKTILYYDPRGQVIRTVNPDGSEQRVIFGVPVDLANPDHIAPTVWETYTYDANDNAGRTDPDRSARYREHWNTPASATVDALGRTVEAVARNGVRAADWYTSRSTYDIRGNLLTVTDELGRLAFHYTYDLANRPLRVEQLDAGVRRTVLDAAGNVLEQRDARGAILLQAYDSLNRATHLWARDGGDEPVTLRGRSMYGDAPESGLTRAEAAERNSLGKLYRQYDEAGLLTFEAYDFKGNVLDKVRQVVKDDQILAVFDVAAGRQWQVPAFRVDWQPAEGETPEERARAIVDPIKYRTSLAYDALNRITTMQYPAGAAGARKTLHPRYNRAGALERVLLDDTVYVERMAYSAKGQRTLITYGNGVITRYGYEPLTFRLVRLRTERYTQPAALAYRPGGAVLQDLAYEYDLVGNMFGLHDRTPDSGVPSDPDRLDRAFTYDPLYRLLSATGRECDVPPPMPWDGGPRCTDLTRSRRYTEQYRYDPPGNMLQLQHSANDGSFTRQVTLVANTNRLAMLTVGSTSYAYGYDEAGNLTYETTSRHFEWDHSDRMRVYRTQSSGAEPSVHAHYLYDAGGQRVKKLVRKQGGQVETTVYVDGLFEHCRLMRGATTLENWTLYVMDDQKRIALIRLGEPFPDDVGPSVQYQLGDHLGSSNVVVDATGALVNREEYTPYGETSFGSFAKKRYRFTGKERDEESGLYYHGARYYAPWLARWASCDPTGPADGLNPYAYVGGRPLILVDEHGTMGEPALQLTDEVARWVPVVIEGGKSSSLGSRLVGAVSLGTLAVGAAGAAAGVFIQHMFNKWEQELNKVDDASSRLRDWKVAQIDTIVRERREGKITPEQASLQLRALRGQMPSDSEIQASLKDPSGSMRKSFMADSLKTILSGCQGAPHPLEFLVDRASNNWKSRTHLSQEPTVQAGHTVSGHSGRPFDLALEDSFYNQLTNWTGERADLRVVFEKPSIDICGVRVELKTLQNWAKNPDNTALRECMQEMNIPLSGPLQVTPPSQK